MIELHASPEVSAYLGGPRRRDELERVVPEVPGRRSGYFVVEHDGGVVGTVTLTRRDPDRPGGLASMGGSVELSYLLLPRTWGRGYATEACTAALGWLAEVLLGEPVVLCTQTANEQSMRLAEKLGFTEVGRFEEFGAEQWFGVRHPRPTRGRLPP